MKVKLTGIGFAALKGSTELLMILPLLLITGVYLFPEQVSLMLWLITLPLCYAVGFTVNQLLHIRKMALMLVMVILVGAMASFMVSGQTYGFFIMLPFAAVFLYRGARLVTVAWSYLFPVTMYAVGLVIYFVSSFVLQFVPSFEPYLSVLTWFGLLALAVTLLMTNQATMKQETLSGDKEPVLASGVLLQNRILIVLVLLLIVLVVFARKLQAAFVWLKDQIIAWLIRLFSQTSEEPPVNKEAAAPPPPMGLGEAGPPAAWLVWLEKIMMVLVGVALVIGLLMLIYMAAKRLPPLLTRMYQWLMHKLGQRGQQNLSSGYKDDVENLMDWKTLNNNLTGSVKQWLKDKFEPKARWQSMDNRERARYLYRQWIHKHTKDGYKLQKHLTPEEVSQDIRRLGKEAGISSSESIIRIYEQARYSDKQPNETDVEAMKKFIETRGNQ